VKTKHSAQGGAESGAVQVASTLETLAAQLAKLSPEDRAKLAALLLTGQGQGERKAVQAAPDSPEAG
jgi:hypothetical protein